MTTKKPMEDKNSHYKDQLKKLLSKPPKELLSVNTWTRMGLTFVLFSILFAVVLVYVLPFAKDTFFGQRYEKPLTKAQEKEQAAPDEILLKFKPGAKKNAQDRVLAGHGLTIKEEISQIEVKVVKVTPEARDKVIAALSHNPAVDFAEKNLIVKPQVIPNDPYYSSAWHLPKISAPTAWDNAKANNILIGICDTGVNGAHPDLQPILRADLGYNTADGSTNWADIAGHGTAVAGVAAAATSNGIGVAAVGWGANIIPVRITNSTDGSAYVSDIASCVTYSADHGAQVINISYNLAGTSTIDSAGQYAQGKNALTFVAAGNDGINPGWPNYSGFLAVSATDSTDTITSWSNYGSFIDLSAPGNNIVTTWWDGTYGALSGTSAASPVAAGVAVLVFGANPSLTASQAQNILLANTDDLGASGYDIYYGYGRVNAYKAVTAALGGAPPDTTAPTASITSPANGATVSGSITVDVSVSDNVGVTKAELYLDGALFATDTSSPYSFFLDTTTLSNANHTLLAKAYDAAGNVGSSSSITITVSNTSPTPIPIPTNTPTPIPPTPTPGSTDATAPVVSLTNPANGSIVAARSTVNISADASDNVGVSRVEFYVNNTLTCPADTTSPYTCSWKVPGAKNKTYTIQAKAYDAAGNTASSIVTVTAK